MHSFRRKAISLVELLIVIAVLSLIASLVIPSIRKVRGYADRVGNQNNMRQITLAFISSFQEHDGIVDRNLSPDPIPGTSIMGNDGRYHTVEATPGKEYVDGGAFFRVLPYLGYDNIWRSSYGPIGPYKRFVRTEPCNCIGWDYEGNYCITYEACVPIKTVVVYDSRQPAVMGYIAGSVDVKVKPFMGYGDLSVNTPNHYSPLSYPIVMTYNGVSTIDGNNTAYTPLLAESPSSCVYDAPAYTSWTANSSYFDSAKDPEPATPSLEYVRGVSGDYTNREQPIFTGITGDGSSGSTLYMSEESFPSRLAWLKWIDTNIVANLPGATQIGPPNRWIARDPINANPVHRGMMHQVDPSSFSQHEINTADCSRFPDAKVCHLYEWFYNIPIKLKRNRSAFFYDAPWANKECYSSGFMTSIVPGIMNISMLDGSVKTFSNDCDPGIWSAYANGQPPAVE